MDQRRPDEPIRDFVARREPELLEQIQELRDQFYKQLVPKEQELSDILRTKAALGMTAGMQVPDDRERAAEHLASREELWRSFAVAIDTGLRDRSHLQQMTIKELIVFMLATDAWGAVMPAEIGEKIRTAYGRDIGDGSIRPNLARLREEGVLLRDGRGRWELHPLAIKLISAAIPVPKPLEPELTATAEAAPEQAGFLPAEDPQREGRDIALVAWASANAWRAEDDATAKRAAIERHLKLASDLDLAREMKSRGVTLEWEPASEAAPSIDQRLAELTQKLRGKTAALNGAPIGDAAAVNSGESAEKSTQPPPESEIVKKAKRLARTGAVRTGPSGGN